MKIWSKAFRTPPAAWSPSCAQSHEARTASTGCNCKAGPEASWRRWRCDAGAAAKCCSFGPYGPSLPANNNINADNISSGICCMGRRHVKPANFSAFGTCSHATLFGDVEKTKRLPQEVAGQYGKETGEFYSGEIFKHPREKSSLIRKRSRMA